MKRENGITLVALVITIIILIILAGISISSIVGENGIITKAREAKQNIILAEEAESLQLNQLYYELETGNKLPTESDEQLEDLYIKLAMTNATEDKLLKDYIAYSNGELLIGTMPNNGSLNSNLNCGENYVIPEGYTSGGMITANSLESQTQATATQEDILEGKTAYVNGEKITGVNGGYDAGYNDGINIAKNAPIKLSLYLQGEKRGTDTNQSRASNRCTIDVTNFSEVVVDSYTLVHNYNAPSYMVLSMSDGENTVTLANGQSMDLSNATELIITLDFATQNKSGSMNSNVKVDITLY